MSKPAARPDSNFIVKLTPLRTDVECKKCGDGMNAGNTDFGTALVAGFMKQHKCQKVRKP